MRSEHQPAAVTHCRVSYPQDQPYDPQEKARRYEEWSAPRIRSLTLAKIRKEFIQDEQGFSSISQHLVSRLPILEDMPGDQAVVRLGFDLCDRWTDEWLQFLPNLPYISLPVLFFQKDLAAGGEPHLHIAISGAPHSFDMSESYHSRPTGDAPEILAQPARLRHFRQMRGEEQWGFWSERALTRARQDFQRLYAEKCFADQVLILASLIRLLSECASRMYTIRGSSERKIHDARLAGMNELISFIASELSPKVGGYGYKWSTLDFSEDLFWIAKDCDCEYELMSLCGLLIWSDPY
ncbi:MAG: hypothetical protein ABIY70_09545 [Capsulimonas sp.]|uniref:hypothetical protein n=1 Tax=Capsulimonas sp. TaxID=2494211 RepID=UPI0032640616